MFLFLLKKRLDMRKVLWYNIGAARLRLHFRTGTLARYARLLDFIFTLALWRATRALMHHFHTDTLAQLRCAGLGGSASQFEYQVNYTT